MTEVCRSVDARLRRIGEQLADALRAPSVAKGVEDVGEAQNSVSGLVIVTECSVYPSPRSTSCCRAAIVIPNPSAAVFSTPRFLSTRFFLLPFPSPPPLSLPPPSTLTRPSLPLLLPYIGFTVDCHPSPFRPLPQPLRHPRRTQCPSSTLSRRLWPPHQQSPTLLQVVPPFVNASLYVYSPSRRSRRGEN